MSRSPTFRPDVAASVWTCASSTVAAALGMAGLVLTGCVGDRTSDGDPAVVGDGAGVPIVSVTVPPERLTPFCQAMIDLSERLETDPPDDTAALIIETYEGVGGDVPAEIAVEFAAVLDALRRGSVATVPSDSASAVTATTLPTPTTEATNGEPITPEGDEFFDEGYTPDDDPARRVNAYVEFACRDSANNPGPPATAPLDDITTDITTDITAAG